MNYVTKEVKKYHINITENSNTNTSLINAVSIESKKTI